MAIYSDDYKTTKTEWRGEGLIPYGLADLRASDRLRQIGAVLTGAAATADGIDRVVTTGNRAAFHSGLKHLDEALTAELVQRDDYENFESEWNRLYEEKLSDYVSTDAYGLNRNEVDGLLDEFKLKGRAKALGMARVGMLRKARTSWEANLLDAESQGDEQAVTQYIDQGRGVFIPPGQEEEFTNNARRTALENRYVEEARRNPLETLASMEAGTHPVSGDSGLEDKIGSEAVAWGNRLKAEYGRLLLETFENLGDLDDGALELARDRGVISSDQLERFRQARQRDGQETGKSESDGVADQLVCCWARGIDECDGSDEAIASISTALLGAGLPRRDLQSLARRLRQGASVDPVVRREASRELYELYQSGAWGVPGERASLKEWRKSQEELMELIGRYGEQAGDRLLEWTAEKRKRQAQAWVCFDGEETEGEQPGTQVK